MTGGRSKVAMMVAVLCTALGVLSVQTASAETTLEKIRRTGVMATANSFEYVPFGYIENGKMTGFDVDLGEELARRMGVKITWEKIDFKGIIAALTSSRLDLLITAMTYSPERAERIDFSRPYFDGGIGAAYRTGMPISKPDDLKGKVIGVQIGSAGAAWTRDKYAADAKDVKTYDTLFLALKDLESGRVETVVSALPSVRHSVKKLKDIAYSEPWDHRDVGINTRKDDKDLLAEINKHMAAMEADGTMKKLVDKWF
jgi:polar amino acid transport system substrate-binding protein